MNYLKYIYATIISLMVLFGGIYVGENLKATGIQYGATGATTFSPVQCAQTTISGSGINNSQTTVPLTSFTTPAGLPLTMANFGSIGYVVADPNSPTKIENMTFTGIQQNANGTAVLTGVSRGIDFVAPYAASTTLAVSHSGGSYLICSNPAAFYGQQFLFANQIGTSTATLVFSSTTPPYYDEPGAQASGNYISTTSEFASVAYVQAVAVSGAPNATTIVKGLVQLGTALQVASSTSLGATGAALVLASVNSTDTPQIGCAVGYTSIAGAGCNVIATLGGKIRQTWLDIFGTANLWTGTNTFAASTTMNATTTIAASSTVANALRLNGVNYAFPSTLGASSSVLETNSSGQLLWVNFVAPKYTVIDSVGTTTPSTQNTGYATSTSVITLPANTLSASSTINFSGDVTINNGGGSPTFTVLIETSTGSVLGSFLCTANGIFNGVIMNQSSASSQASYSQCGAVATFNTASVNTANAMTIQYVIKVIGSGGFASAFTLVHGLLIVNP